MRRNKEITRVRKGKDNVKRNYKSHEFEREKESEKEEGNHLEGREKTK